MRLVCRTNRRGETVAAIGGLAHCEPGFTLIEVMISLAIVATAIVALLGLHHQSLQSVIRGQELTRAAMLAQEVMTLAELERFPPLGEKVGDFQQLHPGQYPNFRWDRTVEATQLFPDVRKVKVRVMFGSRFSRSFDLVEYMHSPVPPEQGS